MMHRLREAMRSGGLLPPLGGKGRRSKSMKHSWAIRKAHQSRRAKGTAISGAILFLTLLSAAVMPVASMLTV